MARRLGTLNSHRSQPFICEFWPLSNHNVALSHERCADAEFADQGGWTWMSRWRRTIDFRECHGAQETALEHQETEWHHVLEINTVQAFLRETAAARQQVSALGAGDLG